MSLSSDNSASSSSAASRMVGPSLGECTTFGLWRECPFSARFLFPSFRGDSGLLVAPDFGDHVAAEDGISGMVIELSGLGSTKLGPHVEERSGTAVRCGRMLSFDGDKVAQVELGVGGPPGDDKDVDCGMDLIDPEPIEPVVRVDKLDVIFFVFHDDAVVEIDDVPVL